MDTKRNKKQFANFGYPNVTSGCTKLHPYVQSSSKMGYYFDLDAV